MEMFCGKIIKVAESERKIRYMERYRSGHNEAVLKTVCPQGRVGSNPTLSVEYLPIGEVPKLAEGAPLERE